MPKSATAGGILLVGAWILLGTVAYLAPSIIALVRHLDSPRSLVVLNLLVGWTFIGWVICLTRALGPRRTVLPLDPSWPPPSPLLSPDGRYWWDGIAWQPLRPEP